MTTLADRMAGRTTAAPAPAATALSIPKLNIDLFDFQREAVEFALSRNASYLALDMGLGKTPCGIAVAAAETAAGNTGTLIVVPPSLRDNWRREFAKFAPWLTVTVLTGNTPHAVSPSDVYIIGDSTLPYWAAVAAEKRTKFDLHGKNFIRNLIVDEAHRHKNDSNRAKSLASLSLHLPGRRVLLSGTPIPNGRTQEMANQLNILGRDAWNAVGGPSTFWTYYAPKQRFGRGSHDIEGLGERMRDSFMKRLLRHDVINLPNKNRSGVPIEGHGPAVARYKAYEKDLVAALMSEGKDWSGASRAAAIVQLGKLRHMAGLSKVPGIVSYVDNVMQTTSKGVFIVAENNDVMDELSLGLMKYGVATIRGGMSDTAKTKSVDAFNSGKARILVGQITAAGVGLTLHGNGRNNLVVVAQLPWTPADLRQAEDRLHRIGQTSEVQVDITLCEIDNVWTIDERLFGILSAKAFAAGLCIDGEGEVLLEDVIDGVLDSYRS